MQAWIKSKIDGTDPCSMVYVAAERDALEQQDILSKWASFCEDEGHVDDKELGVLWLAADALNDLPELLNKNAELLQKTQQLEMELSAFRADIEAGRLVRVPCKRGDTVWAVRSYRDFKHPQQGVVSEMYFNPDMKLHVIVKHVARGELGKTVFLTHDEAEQAARAAKESE